MAVPAHDERDFAFANTFNLPIKEVVIPRLIDARNPHQSGKEISFRKGIIGVIYNPRTDKYLALKWKAHPWTTFVIGGIEDDESAEIAARREILEETGYKNLRLIRMLGNTAQSEFYAAHKGVNRVLHSQSILFELIDDEQEETSADEKEIHNLVWIDRKEITREKMSHSETDIILAHLDKDPSSYHGEGVLINSAEFNGTDSITARTKLTEASQGRMTTKYKLRDWVFSRQRYWGEPIPVVHCAKCGIVPLPESELPLELPQVEKYEPTDNGDSPLATIESWVNTTCPVCKGPAKRETDTMPNWAGSSWYYLRYADPHNTEAFADPAKLAEWSPVNWYNGGMEHTTLHLLYSRFWHKFLFDQKLVPTHEPYAKRTSHGLIMADDGSKMSKSKGNIVNPDDVIQTYGADTLRLFEMFIGPFEQAVAWNSDGLIGPRRFIERIYRLTNKVADRVSTGTSDTNTTDNTDIAGADETDVILSKESKSLLHKTIKKVSDDIDSLAMNTAVSSLMILLNQLEKEPAIPKKDFMLFIGLLAPFTPHLAEELYAQTGGNGDISMLEWPKFDSTAIVEEEVIIAVQVNGKVRSTIKVSKEEGISEDTMTKKALILPEVIARAGDKSPDKVIFVPSKIINLVYRDL